MAILMQPIIEQLPLTSIRTDGGTQLRVSMNEEHIDDIAQALFCGAEIDAIVVFYDGSEYWLADGFHRYRAAERTSVDTIKAEVRPGSRRDALLYAAGANAAHGLRRTNEDKRNVVKTLLRDSECAKWPDNQIAKQCGVSQPFVGKIRDELSYNYYKIERLVERNGTIYTMNPTNIGHAQLPKTEKEQLPSASCLGNSFPGWKIYPEASFSQQEDEPEEEYELTEEDRYFLAIDTGTLDYYYDELRREAIRRDEEQREMAPTTTENIARRNVDNIPIAVPHISSKNNEWYTPEKYIQAAREVMGGIDLDPASCAQANETVQAARYYDIQSNGLDKEWAGCVWLNPPYGRSEDGSNQDVWSSRLIDQYHDGVTAEAILLVNAAVDTKWFQRLFNYPICFPAQRINFSTPELTISGSTHGSALVYFGPKEKQFVEVFSRFGTVVRRWQ